MRIQNYWYKRMLREGDKNLQMTIEQADEWLARYYIGLLDRVKDQIEAYYARIQSDTPLDAVVSHQLSYNKYIELYEKISKELNTLAQIEIKGLEQRFVELYDSSSLLVSKYMNIHYIPNPEEVIKIVNKIWCQDGKAWSERVWTHIGQLQQSIMTNLSDAVVMGTPIDKVAANIASDFNVGFYDARRLARTEMAHIYNEASLDRYNDAGVTEYQWLADPDKEKVCDICDELNGQRFPISDTEHIPPNYSHPNCRCTIIPILE